MVNIAIFYHYSIMGNHVEVDQHIRSHLTGSGLIHRADAFIVNKSRDLCKYEFQTLELLREFAVNNEDYYILYIHTKGVSRKEQSMYDWREYMLYFLVDNWRECVKEMMNGYDAVGVNHIDSPMRHYQGNFWWAKASYVKTLCEPKKTPLIIDVSHKKMGLTDRHKAEMWVLSGIGKFTNLHHHGVNPYTSNNPPSNYRI